MIEGCPRANTPGCPYASSKRGCHSDEHHKYYPKRDYKTNLEREFRELPENKEQLCRWLHDLVHVEQEGPAKPTVQEMIQALSQIALEGINAQPDMGRR